MSAIVNLTCESEDDAEPVVDVSSDEEDEMADSSAVPRRFQEYRRGRELGRGVSGAVFACRRDDCRGEFAVKAIDLRRMYFSPNAQRQHTLLRREVDILRTLPPHENIVKMLDAFEEGRWFLIVLELISGGDLFSALTARPSSTFLDAEAAYVLRQLAGGLSFLHGRSIIHRDLKLENVLVASERKSKAGVLYNVKITDFGLSKEIGSLCHAHSLVGTHPYTAPEVEARRSYDFTSDLWGLGVCLFIMVTGHFPFDRIPQQQRQLNNIVSAMQCGMDVKSMVAGLLQLEPASRLSLRWICSAEWLQDEFTLSGVEVESKRPYAEEAGAPAQKRRSAGPQRGCEEDLACGAEEHFDCDAVSMDLEDSCCAEQTDPVDTWVKECDSTTASSQDNCVGKEAECQFTDASPVHVAAPGPVVHHYLRLLEHERCGALVNLFDTLDFEQAVVLVNSPEQAVALEKYLAAEEIPTITMHSLQERPVRASCYERFKNLESRVLVSTDFQDLDADNPRVNLVLNFDAPGCCNQYLDRIEHLVHTAALMVTFVVDESNAAVLGEVERRLQVQITVLECVSDMCTEDV